MLLLLGIAAGPTSAPTTAPMLSDPTAAGRAALDRIRKKMFLPASQLYAQAIHPDDSTFAPEPSDCWSAGVQLTALTAAARVDPRTYLAPLRDYVAALHRAYWCVDHGIGGYNCFPASNPPDRYYDDNAWIALGLIEAYEVTHDPQDLQQAELTLHFVLSGEDPRLGGGVFWRERDRATKNTCSNAPAVAAALRVYRYTHDPTLLATARRIYRWTVQHLQDQHDGLYFDGLALDGTLHKKKWSYNTALMIRSGCLLARATGDPGYLRDAERSAASAVARWVDPATGVIHDPSYFAHLLAESLLDLSGQDHDPRWAAVDRRAIRVLATAGCDPNGFYPERWDGRLSGPLPVVRLINQASAARAFFRAAWDDPSLSPRPGPAVVEQHHDQ